MVFASSSLARSILFINLRTPGAPHFPHLHRSLSLVHEVGFFDLLS